MKLLKTLIFAFVCICVLSGSVANAAMLCCFKAEPNSKQMSKEMPCHEKAANGKLAKKHQNCGCHEGLQAQIFPLPAVQREAVIEQISQAISPEPMRSLEAQAFYQPPKQNS